MRKFFKRLFITLLILGAIRVAIIISFNVWLSNAYTSRICHAMINRTSPSSLGPG
jgi:hypothetical protein